MDKLDFMKYALSLAEKSAEEGEVPVGAIVVCDGKIVGEGRNRREVVKNALHHAEIEAINNACQTLSGWRLWKCDLYVTLEPCPMCAGAILNARIERVFYGASDKKSGCAGSKINLLDMNLCNFTTRVTGGILEDECREVIQQFFKDLRERK